MWPVLCAIHLNPIVVFPTTLTCGNNRPNDRHFLEDFVADLKVLLSSGIQCKGTMNDTKGRWATLGEDAKRKYTEEAAAPRAHGQALSPEMRDARIKMHLKKLKLEVWKEASFARH
ncbi:hypothetical protein DPX16_0183 [Anabarilius grahami]|uniref:Uncharacterized protein n=1 Tax=Anabarilius grahami TaxID=495550 RepID=A0A3N0XNC8_ANAGA|nr:hypothetical protein DPX16_0183 [Anabarilius grahami]